MGVGGAAERLGERDQLLGAARRLLAKLDQVGAAAQRRVEQPSGAPPPGSPRRRSRGARRAAGARRESRLGRPSPMLGERVYRTSSPHELLVAVLRDRAPWPRSRSRCPADAVDPRPREDSPLIERLHRVELPRTVCQASKKWRKPASIASTPSYTPRMSFIEREKSNTTSGCTHLSIARKSRLENALLSSSAICSYQATCRVWPSAARRQTRCVSAQPGMRRVSRRSLAGRPGYHQEEQREPDRVAERAASRPPTV